jgi:hypothetical protein
MADNAISSSVALAAGMGAAEGPIAATPVDLAGLTCKNPSRLKVNRFSENEAKGLKTGRRTRASRAVEACPDAKGAIPRASNNAAANARLLFMKFTSRSTSVAAAADADHSRPGPRAKSSFFLVKS